MPKGPYKKAFTYSRGHRSKILNAKIKQRLLELDYQNETDILKNFHSDNESIVSTFSLVEEESDEICEKVNSLRTEDKTFSNEFLNEIVNENEDQEIIANNVAKEGGCLNEPETLEIERTELSLRDKLAMWSVEYNINKSAVNKLLLILNEHQFSQNVDKDLPKDSRTLLKTPRYTVVDQVLPGEYYHFGLENGIKNLIESNKEVKLNEAIILINVDGLPISDSSRSEFWPILGIITSLKGSDPFVIGIYHGCRKPADSNLFLESLVKEAICLIENGMEAYGSVNRIPVKISGFVCDTPARSFICQTKGHSGYYGCNKCLTKGEYIGRTCFPEVNCALRTDENFRNRYQNEHHIGDIPSILETIPQLKMVDGFPLDYMHLVCLGVVKKLIKSWMDGKSAVFKLPTAEVVKLSDYLVSLCGVTSSDFARKPRSLFEVDRWKATEYRQFLLYSGPLVLKNILPKKYYQHLICLHVAIRILASPNLYLEMNQYAEKLLVYFVKGYSVLYGRHLISYNVHSLIHLARDATVYGPLDLFSAFPYENHLQSIKKKLSNSGRPLKQIINRISEGINLGNKSAHRQKFEGPSFKTPHYNGPLLEGCTDPQYKRCSINGHRIGLNLNDHCCVLTDKSIVVIENIASTELGIKVLIGRNFEKVEDYYSTPCASSLVGVYVASQLSKCLKMWDVADVVGKIQKYPIENTNTFLLCQLLHLGILYRLIRGALDCC